MWLTDGIYAGIFHVYARKRIISICKPSRNFPVINVPPISALKWMLPYSLNVRCIFSRGKPQAMSEHFFTSIQRSLISLARWHSNRNKSKRTVCLTLTRLSFAFKKQSGINIVFITLPFQKWSTWKVAGSCVPTWCKEGRTERCSVRVLLKSIVWRAKSCSQM